MKISAAGGWVLDIMYDVDPNKLNIYKSYLQNDKNQIGIKRGGACLIKDIEAGYKKDIKAIISEFADLSTEKKNLGGVAIASIINASQLLFDENIECYFYAQIPDDREGNFLYNIIKNTPIEIDKIKIKTGICPKTFIINDNLYLNHSERSFITVENAGDFCLSLEDLDSDFYKSDLVLISCPHWECKINNSLSNILKRCKNEGALTIVGTAFNPSFVNYKGKWPLGDSDAVFKYIDILIMDRYEAYSYSGEYDFQNALQFYFNKGIKNIIITDGINPVFYYSDGSLFKKQQGFAKIAENIIKEKNSGALSIGDTVGCGDNFAGGVIASIALQIKKQKTLDILDAVKLGNVCGAFATTYYGGVYQEKYLGEKKKKIMKYYKNL
jgi:sugar/nucleoside kinase (ribokinase family)